MLRGARTCRNPPLPHPPPHDASACIHPLTQALKKNNKVPGQRDKGLSIHALAAATGLPALEVGHLITILYRKSPHASLPPPPPFPAHAHACPPTCTANVFYPHPSIAGNFRLTENARSTLNKWVRFLICCGRALSLPHVLAHPTPPQLADNPEEEADEEDEDEDEDDEEDEDEEDLDKIIRLINWVGVVCVMAGHGGAVFLRPPLTPHPSPRSLIHVHADPLRRRARPPHRPARHAPGHGGVRRQGRGPEG